MPEAPAYATLTVLGGPLKGTQLVIDDAVDDVLIGSDPDCRLYLDTPGVSPIHARLWLDTEGAVLHDTRSPAGVWVNDERVGEKHMLEDGDIVWLGEPGGPLSVMIQFRSGGDGASVPVPPPEMPAGTVPPAEWVIEEEASVANVIPEYAATGESLLEDVLEEPAAPAPSSDPSPYEPAGSTYEPAGSTYEPAESTYEPPARTYEPGGGAYAPEGSLFEPEPVPEQAPEPVPFAAEPEPVAYESEVGFEEPVAAEPMVVDEPVVESVRTFASAAEEDPFADAVVLDEPPPAPSRPAPAPSAPGPSAPSDEFFLEEPEPPAAADDAVFAETAFAEPAPAFVEAPSSFVEPEPAIAEPVFADATPGHAVDEEFFFDAPAPAAPRPPADDSFFIEEPSEPAPGAQAEKAPASEGDWSAASEPLVIPHDPPPPPKVEAPPVLPVVAAAPPAPAAPAPPASTAEAARPPRPTGARPAAGARPAVARPAARPAPASSGGGALKWVLIAVGVLAVAAAGGFFALRGSRTPRITAVDPPRARAGERVAIVGEHFDTDAQGNTVAFGSGVAGRIVSASPTRLEVEVPALPLTGESKVPVVVTAGGKPSEAFELAVFKAPRVHGISPSVAMPGEEVTLAGVDWGPGAIVKFGDLPAAVLDATPTSLRVRVPDVTDPVGTSLPVVVSMGADPSNQAPFVIGRIPLVMGVEPAGVAPGDVVTIKGRGFPLQPALNDLKIGGSGALVISAFDNELKAIVPWAPPGDAPLELHVPRSENVGTASMTIAPRSDPLEFRFVAGPIRDDPSHDHAVLATALGPAFVLSASGGRSAADRAHEAQQRLAEAAVALKASLTADIEVRDLEGSPALGLTGKAEPLFEVTAEDAAAYNEDWTGLRGKGGPVTRARLALWWGAVARDQVLLLIRGEKPHFTAELAPEGRVLGQVADAARKTGKFGLPQEVVDKAPAGWREALRLVALRVPATVKGPAPAPGTSPAPEAAPGGPLKLDGIWSGSETEGGTVKYVTVTFTRDGGTLTYERALTMSVPIESVQAQKAAVRFSAKSGSRTAWYLGKWDGLKLRGTIHADSPTGTQTGTFELDRKR
jgi:pSer/pThr/pTyr-binding forkhead associated (FHA) protein